MVSTFWSYEVSGARSNSGQNRSLKPSRNSATCKLSNLRKATSVPVLLDSADQLGNRRVPKWFSKWNEKSADFTFHVPFHRPILSYKWPMHTYSFRGWIWTDRLCMKQGLKKLFEISRTMLKIQKFLQNMIFLSIKNAYLKKISRVWLKN